MQNSPCVSYGSLGFFQVWKWEFSFEVHLPLECLDSAGGFPALFCQKQTHSPDLPCGEHRCVIRVGGAGQASFWMEHSFQCSTSTTAQLCAGVAARGQGAGLLLQESLWPLGVHSKELHLSVKWAVKLHKTNEFSRKKELFHPWFILLLKSVDV